LIIIRRRELNAKKFGKVIICFETRGIDVKKYL
jgi:hypothetical protein